MAHLIEEDAGRLRIVVDGPPADRRIFRADLPDDATVAELEHFHAELVRIISRRRERAQRDREITKNERPP